MAESALQFSLNVPFVLVDVVVILFKKIVAYINIVPTIVVQIANA
jgi:hypothetical protein